MMSQNTSIMELMDEDFENRPRTPNLRKIRKRESNRTDSCWSNQHPHFYSLLHKVIVVLEPGTKFSFAGKIKVKVIYGAIEVFGSVLDTSALHKTNIYSPRGSSYIAIESCQSPVECNIEQLWDALTEEGVDRSVETNFHQDIRQCDEGWSVLLLENLENTLTRFLDAHCPLKIFPKVDDSTNYSWSDPKRAEVVLQANLHFNNLERQIEPQWPLTKTFLKRWKSVNQLRVAIIGGKSVGKSTSMKYLINSFLSVSKKVILVDLDPGQAEFTPHSCISINVISECIFGPNFSHLKTPYHQLFIGEYSITRCIVHYMKCVEKLIDYLNNQEKLAGFPVIINTMGFCKGVGKDLTVHTLKLVNPTDVIQIMSGRAKNNFEDQLDDQFVNSEKIPSFCTENCTRKYTCNYNFHCIKSLAEGKCDMESWKMEPYQKRELVTLSYLSQIIKNADEISLPEHVSPSLLNVIPYKLSLSMLCISSLQSNLSPTHILAAINGNLVALCGVDPDQIESCKDSPESKNYPLVLSRRTECVCYGYGIVRGIDTIEGYISINTPLSKSILKYVNCIVGSIPMPLSLLTLDQRGVPYSGNKGDLPTSRESRRGYNRN